MAGADLGVCDCDSSGAQTALGFRVFVGEIERFRNPKRLASYFGLVARDPATGELGVAVQSHWFSVGSTVSWAEAGVGAVATQSFTDASG